MDSKEEEKTKVINDWVYKPYQIIESIHFRNCDKGIVSGINTFQIKSMNILFQALHNNIVKNIDYKDSLGYSCYGLEIKEFLNKLNYNISDIQNIKRDLSSLMDLKSETIGNNDSFKLSNIIREVEFNTDEGMIYFKVADIVDYIFKNNYIMLEDETMKHYVNDEGNTKIGYARININSYPKYTKPKHAKALILYEYLISKRDVIQNGNHIKINIDKLKSMLNCNSYYKNSDIIKKMIEPAIENIQEFSGLEIFYKCETSLKYNRITSISFKVYTTDTTLCKYLHSTSELEKNKDNRDYYFICRKEGDEIFSFSSVEDMESMIKKNLTNVNSGYIKNKTKEVHTKPIIEKPTQSIEEYDDYPIMSYDFEQEIKKQDDIELLEDYYIVKYGFEPLDYFKELKEGSLSYWSYKNKMMNLSLGQVGETTYKKGIYLTDSDIEFIKTFIKNNVEEDEEELF